MLTGVLGIILCAPSCITSLLYLKHYLLLLYSVSLSPTVGHCSCSVIEKTLVWVLGQV
jgi:hypothetical protein